MQGLCSICQPAEDQVFQKYFTLERKKKKRKWDTLIKLQSMIWIFEKEGPQPQQNVDGSFSGPTDCIFERMTIMMMIMITTHWPCHPSGQMVHQLYQIKVKFLKKNTNEISQDSWIASEIGGPLPPKQKGGFCWNSLRRWEFFFSCPKQLNRWPCH